MADRARLRAEGLAALAVAVVAAILLAELWRNPIGTPIFGVSAGTLPSAMALVLVVVSVLLAAQTALALRRAPPAVSPGGGRSVPADGEEGADDEEGADGEDAASGEGRRGGLRLAGLFLACLLFAVALPWLGFLLSGALLVAAAALLLGNRRYGVILAMAVLAPLLLSQFFERAMVIYLPAGRLFQ